MSAIFDEDEFARLLDLADTLAAYAQEEISRLLPAGADHTTMPEIAVWRLHLAASASFMSIVQCLRISKTSLGGYILIRGLIEAWSHLDFIADDTEGGSRALRAIGFEDGILGEWDATIPKIPEARRPEDGPIRPNPELMRLWTANGGSGAIRDRTRREVTPTLKKISVRGGPDWLVEVYSTTSAATHMTGVDHLLHQLEVTWADPFKRCFWLQLATICFDYITRLAADSMGAGFSDATSSELYLHVVAILESPLMASVTHGTASE